MDWTSITIRTTTEGAEIVSGMLMSLGLAASEIEDRTDVERSQRPGGKWDMIDPEVFARMEENVKMTLYIPSDERREGTLQEIEQRLNDMKNDDFGIDMGELSMEIGGVDDQDWAENWKKSYKAFPLGQHFVVKPTWCPWEEREGDKIIEMDPGMAFGTGTHETTAMCVQLVEENVKPGMDIIDIGTGSGILAIAAAMMGAKGVIATDLDPLAVKVAEENFERNYVQADARCGDLLEVVSETADVIIANIIADVICMLAAPVKPLVRAGGTFICSGIAAEKKDDVIAALNNAGFIKLDVREQGPWCAIAAKVD